MSTVWLVVNAGHHSGGDYCSYDSSVIIHGEQKLCKKIQAITIIFY